MLVAFGVVGSEFVSFSDRSELSLVAELAPGTPLAETRKAADRIEALLGAIPEVRQVFTTVGVSSEGYSGEANPAAIDISLALVDKQERRRSDVAVSREIKERVLTIPGIQVRVASIGLFGTANGSPVQLNVTGSDREEVSRTALRLADLVRGVRGTEDVRLSLQTGKPERRVVIDHQKVAVRGLTMAELGYALRLSLTGDDDSRLRLEGREVPLRLRLDQASRSSTRDLETMAFINAQGQLVELRQVAQIESATSSVKLERRDRAPSVTVLAQVQGRPTGDVGSEIRALVAAARLPSGVQIAYAGDLEMQDESFARLGVAFLVAVLFVYLVLVALYNSFITPLVVLLAIPVAVVGALAALALAGQALSIFSMLGLIILVGLVGKNAILLVDRANSARGEGMAILDALLDAGRKRMRPILMTTVAMVFGILPVALASGAGAEWKNGLAWVLIGGLVTSTLLTLVMVPALYLLIVGTKERVALWLSRVRVRREPEASLPILDA
jgi:HAE1 family hydrophobic/amphiphilic exporter-1